MTIAHYFTLFRLLIAPLFLFVYLNYDSLGITFASLPFVLLALLIVAEASDLCDGFLARYYNQVTELGKVLDPMADSIYRLSIFLTFTAKPIELPLSLIFILLYRDSIISTLRTVCALKGYALAARPSGKLKAIVQALAAFGVLLFMIPYTQGALSQEQLSSYAFYLVGASALYTIYSGTEYLYANRHHIQPLLTFSLPRESPRHEP